jgi:hypothetical protein
MVELFLSKKLDGIKVIPQVSVLLKHNCKIQLPQLSILFPGINIKYAYHQIVLILSNQK